MFRIFLGNLVAISVTVILCNYIEFLDISLLKVLFVVINSVLLLFSLNRYHRFISRMLNSENQYLHTITFDQFLDAPFYTFLVYLGTVFSVLVGSLLSGIFALGLYENNFLNLVKNLSNLSEDIVLLFQSGIFAFIFIYFDSFYVRFGLIAFTIILCILSALRYALLLFILPRVFNFSLENTKYFLEIVLSSTITFYLFVVTILGIAILLDIASRNDSRNLSYDQRNLNNIRRQSILFKVGFIFQVFTANLWVSIVLNVPYKVTIIPMLLLAIETVVLFSVDSFIMSLGLLSKLRIAPVLLSNLVKLLLAVFFAILIILEIRFVKQPFITF